MKNILEKHFNKLDEIHVLNLTALIAAKRAMARPRDHHPVLELEVIKNSRPAGESQ
jgi:hypothetical protein